MLADRTSAGATAYLDGTRSFQFVTAGNHFHGASLWGEGAHSRPGDEWHFYALSGVLPGDHG